jgi:hypothetical protein
MSRTKDTNVKGLKAGKFYSTAAHNLHMVIHGPNVDKLAVDLAQKLKVALDTKPQKIKAPKPLSDAEFLRLMKVDSAKAMAIAFPSNYMAQIARDAALDQLLNVVRHAFESGNADRLRKLADAIESISRGPIDPVRAKLILRQWCAKGEPNVTVREIQERFASEGYFIDERQIWRMLTEIGFPRKHRGRPAKVDN